jgi:hypothetical protein
MARAFTEAQKARRRQTTDAWKARNKERLQVVRAARWEQDLEANRAKARAYYHQNKERIRVQGIACRFGLSANEYRGMLAQQGGVCAICCQFCSARKHLAVDHCHKTGKVRGLLCNSCNTGLGMLQDSARLLAAAQAYLAGHAQ